MALKPTIYKFEINLSDLDRGVYDQLNLTVAQHPSESVERMMARILAFCCNAGPGVQFTKGVSATDEPDIWQHDLSGQLQLWIDIGEPSFDRIKKSARQSGQLKIYSINTKSDIWWSKTEDKVRTLPIEVFQLQWTELVALAKLVDRTNLLHITIADNECFVSSSSGDAALTLKTLLSNL